MSEPADRMKKDARVVNAARGIVKDNVVNVVGAVYARHCETAHSRVVARGQGVEGKSSSKREGSCSRRRTNRIAGARKREAVAAAARFACACEECR